MIRANGVLMTHLHDCECTDSSNSVVLVNYGLISETGVSKYCIDCFDRRIAFPYEQCTWPLKSASHIISYIGVPILPLIGVDIVGASFWLVYLLFPSLDDRAITKVSYQVYMYPGAHIEQLKSSVLSVFLAEWMVKCWSTRC